MELREPDPEAGHLQAGDLACSNVAAACSYRGPYMGHLWCSVYLDFHVLLPFPQLPDAWPSVVVLAKKRAAHCRGIWDCGCWISLKCLHSRLQCRLADGKTAAASRHRPAGSWCSLGACWMAWQQALGFRSSDVQQHSLRHLGAAHSYERDIHDAPMARKLMKSLALPSAAGVLMALRNLAAHTCLAPVGCLKCSVSSIVRGAGAWAPF